MKCTICGRMLDRDDDPLSANCGGDCWGCVGELEAEMRYEPSLTKVTKEIEQGIRKALHEIVKSGETPSTDLMVLYIIYTDTEIYLSKKRYESWREIQDEYSDYKASFGPWDSDEVIDFLSQEYSSLYPSARNQVIAFVESPEQVATLKFRDE